MLLYIMLYVVLAYLMLFAALTNAVCLNNASLFFCILHLKSSSSLPVLLSMHRQTEREKYSIMLTPDICLLFASVIKHAQTDRQREINTVSC